MWPVAVKLRLDKVEDRSTCEAGWDETRRIAAFGAMIATALILYGAVLIKLTRDWAADPNYSHGFIVVPLVAWLTWHRRRELAQVPILPAASGFCLLAAAFVLLLLGTLGAELFLTRVSLLMYIVGVIVSLWGWRQLRVNVFSLVLLALAIPIPAIVVTRLTLSLQLMASFLAEIVLNVCGIPVLRDGNVLMLARATLQVAEACSGLRSLVALMTMAVLVAKFGDSGWFVRTAILASSVPIAIVVNGSRVAATAIAVQWFGKSAAEGAVHETFGAIMFIAALGLLLVCGRAASSVRGAWRIGV